MCILCLGTALFWVVNAASSGKKLSLLAVFSYRYLLCNGACGSVVVEALRFKPEGHGINSQWCHWNFPLT
jgi:hypothetical protein